MKKLIICVIIFLILCSGVPEKEFSLLDYFEGDYVSYSQSPKTENSLNLGFCYASNEKVLKPIGESVTISNFEPSSALKELDAKVVKTEYLQSGATVIYAYSNLIPENVEVDNQKVNLQIAYYDTHSVVGWPLILGSF